MSRKTHKAIVFGVNSNGDQDAWFCKVSCTRSSIDHGDVYNFLLGKAAAEGYEGWDSELGMIPLLEEDYLFSHLDLESKFVWDSAETYTHEKPIRH